ncbi:MAG: efflux RND transporter periplasmic adaptor subunit [Deltaproteobacteria bacterium]|nr:efflux RND transporter periplasmic adaptor subunit [Deltaproteobacteria bacterium]MCB9489191.1 efflux RND transporter periplasmic adaptor subunit [Deltaproteobacteria bacterium]
MSDVIRDEFVDRIQAIGNAKSNESVELNAKVTETVRTIHFRDGQFVKKGQSLVELTRAEESANLAEARSSLDNAKREYDRAIKLEKDAFVSEAQVDKLRSDLEMAQARVGALQARIGDRLIRAPFDGIMGLRSISPGDVVTPQTVVATVDDISVIKLDFSVPEAYIGVLKDGMTVYARTNAYPDRRFEGEVTSIDSRVDPVTRSITVRAEIANQDFALRPGMLLTVDLVRDRSMSLMVPESALVPAGDKQYVLVVEDGKAVRREVTIGRRVPGKVEIVDGVKEGETVIIEGTVRVRPGGAVKIVERREMKKTESAEATADTAKADESTPTPTPAPADGSDG